jgi:dTMP kinase
MTRGLFLCLDGLDGTGKSTQCRLLADWLRERGETVVACREPGGTALGDRVRPILLEGREHLTLAAELFLFMASRAQLTAEVIRPALGAGHVVVCDRYLLASVVYQGYAGGLDPDELWRVGRLATGGLEPDLTLVLDLPVEQARARRDRPADHIENRSEAYQLKVRQGFILEARRRPDRVRLVSAAGAVDEVQRLIRQEVERVLAARARPSGPGGGV